MEIKRALDWDRVSVLIRDKMSTLGYNPDLQKVYWNIDKMITELSKLEVDARRTQKFSYLDAKVEEINKAIHHLDQLILIGLIMK
jgi:hypothetical protein